MQHLNWGIIGCGDVTEVKSGPAFNKIPHSSLVAVMRRSAEKAKDYAARHGVPKWYADAQQLIDDPDVNAIYIATPPAAHEDYALRALQAGKPVYLEKPMATSAAAAARIAAASLDMGIKLSIAHYRRQQPLFLAVKSLLEQGSIGRVQFVTLQFFQPEQSGLIAQTEDNWRLDPLISGGGLFHDLAPHQLDLMLYFFGRPLRASGLSTNTGGLYAADDTVAGQILFEQQVFFNGAWCFADPDKKDECLIHGSEGQIRFRIFERAPVVICRQGQEEEIHFEPLPHVQQPMIGKVAEYFRGQGPNPCSAAEGVEVMRLIDAFTGKQPA